MRQPARKSLMIAMLLGSAFTCRGADVPSTEPSPGTRSAESIAESKMITDRWARLPLLPKRPIGQVVRFSESEGMLVVSWPILDSGSLGGRVPLADMPGDAVVQCYVSARQPDQRAPSFEYYDFTHPDGVTRHLQITNAPGQLQVVQDTESADGIESISLLENLFLPDTEPVTLRYQRTSGSDHVTSLVWSAPTLSALRRDHPLEFAKYLRPLLHQFHQDHAVLADEDEIAWRVMADAWKPPPGLAGRLMPLVAQLNSDDYSARERAQKELREMGTPAALFLLSADSRSWTPEQKSRIGKLVAQFSALTPDQVKTLGHDVNFLLDCLASDDGDLRAATLLHLENVVGRKIEFDVDQPEEPRMAAIERLRQTLDPAAATRDESK